jgi:subtilisin family serine protease
MDARRAVWPCSLIVCFFVLLAAAAAPAAPAAASGPLRADAPAGASQVIVQAAPGASLRDVRALAASERASLVRAFRKPGTASDLYCLRPTRGTAAALAAALSDDPAVVRAVPDARIAADVYPNDTDYRALWGLYMTDKPLAWNLTTGSSDVVVAVIDSGVDYGHADLAANMWRNPGEVAGNGVDDDGNGYADDVHGTDAVNHDTDPYDDGDHGTGVAGIVGAVGNNQLGLTGAAWNVRIMALKALGSNLVGTNSTALECIQYAIRMKTEYGVNIVAINASWGGSPYPQDPLLRQAVAAAGQAGIVWCASAGNDGRDNDAAPRYPSSYDVPTILAVAASNSSDQLPYWTNYGATSVDLAAPGDNIKLLKPGSLYAWRSGTSMAAPDVAGVVALSASRYRDETALQRVDRILTGVEQIPAAQGKVLTGGRLNAYLTLAADPRPVTTVSGIPDGWSAAPVTATFTASDGTGIGVERSEYSLDGAPYQAGDRVTVAADGEHSLLYRSVDKAANVEPARNVTVRVDGTPPDVVAAGADDQWHAEPVTVRLSATDPGAPQSSGVAYIEYRESGGAWNRVAGASVYVVVPAAGNDGEHSYEYRAADLAGNVSAARTFSVRIGGGAVSLQVTGADDAWHKGPVEVRLDGSAPGGVSSVQYRRAGASAWTTVSGASAVVTFSGEGVAGYEARAVATSGAMSPVQAFTVKIDATAPVSTLSGADSAWHKAAVMLTLAATDSASGVQQSAYSLDGVNWTLTSVFSVAAQGTSTVRYRSTDVAGNVEAVRSVTVKIDSIAPTTTGLATTGYRNRYAYLNYRVDDDLPGSGQAVVTSIAIRTTGGKTVRTYKPNATVTVNKALTYRFLCNLSTGTYRFTVQARDLAGNTASGVAAGTLTVRR